MTASAELTNVDISVVIAVHNNASTLAELCRRISVALPGSEVIVVDDRSTDAFAEVIRGLDVEPIALTRRSGQSEAIRQGLARSRGSVCCVLDADLEDPPEALPRMIEALQVHHAQVAFSSRERSRRITSRVFRRLMCLLYPTLTPQACLCFAMTREAAAAVVRTARPGDYLVAVIGALKLRAVQIRVVREPRRESGSGYHGWRRAAHGVRTVAAAIRLRWQVSTGVIQESSR